jgi:hypothetical protein
MNRPVAERTAEQRRMLGRWLVLFGFLGGPIVWTGQLLLSEILIAAACASGSSGFSATVVHGIMVWELILVAVFLLFALAALIADGVALTAWRRSRLQVATSDRGGMLGALGWMGLAGILLSTLFLIGILFAGLPIFWLSGCT